MVRFCKMLPAGTTACLNSLSHENALVVQVAPHGGTLTVFSVPGARSTFTTVRPAIDVEDSEGIEQVGAASVKE